MFFVFFSTFAPGWMFYIYKVYTPDSTSIGHLLSLFHHVRFQSYIILNTASSSYRIIRIVLPLCKRQSFSIQNGMNYHTEDDKMPRKRA